MCTHAIARLAGFSVADIVRHDDVVLADVQQLPPFKQHAGELRTKELVSRAAGTMKKQNSVGRMTVGILHRCAKSRVVDVYVGHGFARLEVKIVNDKVTLLGRGPAGRSLCCRLRSQLRLTQCHYENYKQSQTVHDSGHSPLV